MLKQIQGLHHVTSMASDARANNGFFTDTLGLRRVKKTVNFDAPEVYHLYYGDEHGTPGLGDDLLPLPQHRRPRQGHRRGRRDRLRGAAGGDPLLARAAGGGRRRRPGRGQSVRRGAAELHRAGRRRAGAGRGGGRAARPGPAAACPHDAAIRGFHSAALRLRDAGATDALLRFMGYEPAERAGELVRYRHPGRQRRGHRSTSRPCPAAAAPISGRARCIISPSRCPTGRRSSRCARRWSIPAPR